MRITLKAARTNVGLTQKEAAAKLKVSEDTVSNWENSKSYPDVPQIEKIEEVYGVSYADIIFLPKKKRLKRKS